MTARWNRGSPAWGMGVIAGLCAAACAPSSSGSSGSATPAASASAAALANMPPEAWGIRPVSLRPTLGGKLLDFRYQVLDAEKALPLFDRKMKPYLFDPASGQAMGVREDDKLGALRSSGRNPPIAGKQYFVLFENGQGTVKRGEKVTVVLGDCKLRDIVVD